MNTRRLLTLLTFVASCVVGSPQEVLHHEIHVRIAPETGLLEGDCTVEVSRPKQAGQEVTFELLDGELLGVEVDGVSVTNYRYGGDPGWRPYDLKTLSVPLPAAAGEGVLRVRVRYRDANLTASAISPEDEQPFSLGQITLDRGSFCSHVPYYPYVQYQGHGADLYFTVPEEFVVVSSGRLMGISSVEAGWVTYHWRSEVGSGILPYPFACHRYQVLRELAADGSTELKGALALDMLRALLGPEKFLEGMRTYFTRDVGQVTDLRDFAAAFEQASGTELWWFFDQWYNRAGHPKLSFSWSAGRNEPGWSVQLQIRQEQSDALYRLKVPVQVRGADLTNTLRTTIMVSSKEESFSFGVPFVPRTIDLDPERRMAVEVFGPMRLGIARQGQQIALTSEEVRSPESVIEASVDRGPWLEVARIRGGQSWSAPVDREKQVVLYRLRR